MHYRLPELQGKPKDITGIEAELTIRKLFRMCVHFEYFATLCRHPNIVRIINQLLGPNLKLVQSMALLKPPGVCIYIVSYYTTYNTLGSGEKKWHQDNAYFRLVPASIVVSFINST